MLAHKPSTGRFRAGFGGICIRRWIDWLGNGRRDVGTCRLRLESLSQQSACDSQGLSNGALASSRVVGAERFSIWIFYSSLLSEAFPLPRLCTSPQTGRSKSSIPSTKPVLLRHATREKGVRNGSFHRYPDHWRYLVHCACRSDRESSQEGSLALNPCAKHIIASSEQQVFGTNPHLFISWSVAVERDYSS